MWECATSLPVLYSCTFVGEDLLVLIALRGQIVSDLSSEGKIHIQVAGVDHRVPWLTQKEIPRHNEEEEKESRGSEALSICRVERRWWLSLSHSVDLSGLWPNIYSQVLFFNKMVKEITISGHQYTSNISCSLPKSSANYLGRKYLNIWTYWIHYHSNHNKHLLHVKNLL